MKTIKNQIQDILANKTYLKKINNSFVGHIDLDRSGCVLSKETLIEIFSADDPKTAFNDYIQQLQDTYDTHDSYHDYEYISDIVFQNLPSDIVASHKDFIQNYIYEICHFELDINNFNIEYNSILMLDTGDAKYDFACNNALNYYDNWSKILKEPSSMLWLAKQQNKDQLLLSEMQRIYNNTIDGEYVNRDTSNDSFIESMLQELENNSCCCAGLTFLLRIKLFDLLEIKTKINNKSKENITIPKNVMCGLFDTFAGGGSVLEIKLDTNIIVSYDMIYDVWIDGTKMHGHDIDETYGLVQECWECELKFT